MTKNSFTFLCTQNPHTINILESKYFYNQNVKTLMEIRESEEVLLLLQMPHWLMVIHILHQPNFPEVWPLPPPPPPSQISSPFFLFLLFCQTFFTSLSHTGWRHMWMVPDQNYLFYIWLIAFLMRLVSLWVCHCHDCISHSQVL